MAERSRSPALDTARLERISRSVASFGRYGSKRPEGLLVDGQGRFRLQDLVACWGRDVGLDEQAILRAVTVHMLFQKGGTRLPGTRPSGARLSGARLSGTRLSGGRLTAPHSSCRSV